MATDPIADSQEAMLVPARLPGAGGGPGSQLARPSRGDDAPPPEDWRRILSAVRAYRWLVIAVTGGSALAGVVGAHYLKPTYQARATVWIEIPDPAARERDQGPIQTAQLLGTATGWLDLLRSHVVLDDVVRQWRLYLTPRASGDSAALATFAVPGDVRPGRYRVEVDAAGRRFRLVDADERAVLQEGAVGDSIGARLGFAWVPPAGALRPGGTVAFTVATASEAAQKLAEELRVRAAQDGNFVRIEQRGPDAAAVTGVVNAVAERFVAAAADLKRQRLRELSAILKEQLDRAQENLRAAESALTTFRVRHAVRPSEGPAQGADGRRTTADPTYASYVDLQVEIGGLTRDGEAIARALAHAGDSGVAVDQLAMIGAVQRSSELTAALKELTDRQAELRALRFRYADTYLPVRRLTAQVDTLARRVIPDLSRAVLAGLAARARALQQRSDSIGGELRRAPPLALDEIRLQRDQGAAEQLFTDLQHRYQEARLAEVSTLPDVRILERAVQPTRPVSNTKPLLVIVAVLTGFGVGVLGAVLLERVDPKVRYPDEVTRAMGVPILGAVPHVQRANGGRHRAEAADGVKAVEALRGIRLNVQHAYGAAGPVVITVTSPGRGEGKSFVTCNLAQAFADVGYRTLLIDGDVRLGALHRALRGRRRPGLTDVLAGAVASEAVVQGTAHRLLGFIGAGSRMHRGPELLCSAAVPQLLTKLRPGYDVILLDSAPLAAGVDPYALGTAAGSVLLVLRTGVTDRAIAEAKVEALHRLPIRVLGAVLNDVRPGAIYSYYGYSLSGSEVREEDPHGAAGEILLPPDASA
jgi:capsular exopolysaccharide synthesis family protein